jgi:hypothetical protein
MNCEEFLGTVLAPNEPEQQRDAMLGILRHGYDEAEALPDPAARPRAHMVHILQAKAYLEALAAPQVLDRMRESALKAVAAEAAAGGAVAGDVAAALGLDTLRPLRTQLLLVQSGGEYFLSMLEQVRQQYRHRVERRDYRDAACGAYPFRDATHEQVHVVSAQPLSAPALSGRRYAYADVEPYVNPGLGDAERAALYLSRLQVRTLEAADLKRPDETALVGQRGVFATQPIAAGTCVGVYGGQIMDKMDIFILQDDRYLISASLEAGRLGVNGENMMSMSNTLFVLDGEGKPSGHPATGYNIESAAFQARLADGREIVLRAFFAIADIAAGDELRWNYDLGRCVPA